MSEQRASFRVKDKLIISYEAINHEQYLQGIRELKASMSGVSDGSANDLESLDGQVLRLIEQIKLENLELSQALELLNNKINLLSHHIMLKEGTDSNDLLKQEPQKVSISAAGMSLGCNTVFEKGNFLHIKIILLPHFIYIPMFGEVTSCIEDSDTFPPYHYRLMIKFDFMLEEDQDKLIQHMLRRQSEFLRQKRLSGGE